MKKYKDKTIQKIRAISYLKKLLKTNQTGVKINNRVIKNEFNLRNLAIFCSIIKVKTPKNNVFSLSNINNFSCSNKESSAEVITSGFITPVM